MAQKAADTGVGPTLYIAIEQYFPEGARLSDSALWHEGLCLADAALLGQGLDGQNSREKSPRSLGDGLVPEALHR